MRTVTPGQVDALGRDECFDLLASTDVGRIAVIGSDGIDVFPINYRVTDGFVYFASAPGSKLADIARDSTVTFEADSFGDGARWSVVIKGDAVRLSSDADIERSGVKQIVSLTPTAKWNYVRIEPLVVSGRRFAVHSASERRDVLS